MTNNWQPISKEDIYTMIHESEAKMHSEQKRFWDAIKIIPEKWKLPPWGDLGGGFWVVAISGCTVVWYNDIEEGFNKSRYSQYGLIDEYWCNQDELHWMFGML